MTASQNPAAASAPIGVFDSGLGGLSVLREVRNRLPAEHLIYIADSGAAPYGERSGEFIESRAFAMAEFLVREGVKALVVACNTATAVAVGALRARYAIPIVAVEPAVKPAAVVSKTGIIGVLATSRTLASENFRRLSLLHSRGARIVPQPCPGLVEQVERGHLAAEETRAMVRGFVLPLINDGADTLVLGCTHYPFLLPLIREVAGPAVNILDPATAVAREVQRRLEVGALMNTAQSGGRDRFLTTGATAHVEGVLGLLWGRASPVEAVPAEFGID